MSCINPTKSLSRSDKRKAPPTSSVGFTMDCPKVTETPSVFIEDCDQSQDPEKITRKAKAKRIPVPESASDEDLDSSSEDDEQSFREHIRAMMHTHGLELTKMLFQLEVAKCKKPKTEPVANKK